MCAMIMCPSNAILPFLCRCGHPPKVGAQGRETVALGANGGHSIQIGDHPQPAGAH